MVTSEQEERYQRIIQNRKNPNEVNYDNVEIVLYKSISKPKKDIGHKEQRFILQERDWKCGNLGVIHTEGLKHNDQVIKKIKNLCNQKPTKEKALKKLFRELQKRGIQTKSKNVIIKNKK